jgi:hypothetical protein
MWNDDKPSNTHYEAATEALKNKKVKKEVLNYIRYGRGFSDPTDLFDSVEVPKTSFDSLSSVDEDGDECMLVLYSPQGAVALMEVATGMYKDQLYFIE